MDPSRFARGPLCLGLLVLPPLPRFPFFPEDEPKQSQRPKLACYKPEEAKSTLANLFDSFFFLVPGDKAKP